ncbi:hypothetical protein H4219_002750 [Mycoemilia scoparia]|uniref:Complex 1 LYR protein domain-containing protein n=1 Tax=Mycoemilia scoparia TaxID=417184 RepID=A0A9W8A630_9FUNG|nr:hypothetical protein H4219_002750 [Mycoemilia scoparia]
MSLYRTEALTLYRNLLRSSRLFKTYNFREYVYRRSRDAFRENKNVSDSEKIQELLKEGNRQLQIAQRQGAINGMFSMNKVIIENTPQYSARR